MFFHLGVSFTKAVQLPAMVDYVLFAVYDFKGNYGNHFKGNYGKSVVAGGWAGSSFKVSSLDSFHRRVRTKRSHSILLEGRERANHKRTEKS